MKTITKILFATIFLISTVSFAQTKMKKETAKTVELVQTKGKFNQGNLKLKPGNYVFEIENKSVGKDVGFYLHKVNDEKPLVNSDKAGLIPNNEKRQTGIVALEKGEYVYSCPLNPTADYKIIVE